MKKIGNFLRKVVDFLEKVYEVLKKVVYYLGKLLEFLGKFIVKGVSKLNWRKERELEFNAYLTEEDFLDLGFAKIEENTKYMDFEKGNLNLKWGYRPSMRTLSIRWGKSPRFFGVCETKGDLVYLLILIEKYFKR